jgi:transaldolase
MRSKNLRVKLFADGADKAGMLEMCRHPLIKGFTTNPTLMCKAGITDFKAFALDILGTIKDLPISFEVFSDDFEDMGRQARLIAAWGPNVNVKIPVTNTAGHSAVPLIAELAKAGIKLNVTAIMTLQQVKEVGAALKGGPASIVSLFAGRVADTGRDPVPMMKEALALLKPTPNAELLWASPRELLNIFQADESGCHIITVTNDLIKKLELVDKDLGEYSLDTVKMFRNDAVKAGYVLS